MGYVAGDCKDPTGRWSPQNRLRDLPARSAALLIREGMMSRPGRRDLLQGWCWVTRDTLRGL